MDDTIRYATPRRPREDLLTPTRDEHVWVAVDAFRVTPEADELHLDRENLATIEIGCYVCEQAYSKRLLFRRCPGEPSAHDGPGV